MSALVQERLSLTVAGQAFRHWTQATITRDLREIAGSFELTLLDDGRVQRAFPAPPGTPLVQAIECGAACTVAIDGETVLTGWVEDVDWHETANTLEFRVAGRDRTGDLVECAACPTGPAEFNGLTLAQVAQIVCAPFGITVQAQVDVGAPFARLAVNPHETALAFLEKAARQRAVLLVSDGVGGLLLTRGGNGRGPAALIRGDNIVEVKGKRSWRNRFSDVFVKGQSERAAGGRKGAHAAVGLADAPVAAPSVAAAGGAGVLMTGHARDPEITRWRPHVRLTRTQSGMSSTQEQAEWLVRVLRGEGEQLQYGVLDWRAGPASGRGAAPKLGALWRPNEVVAVFDPLGGINADMLVAGVSYRLGAEGMRSLLRVAGVTAYDRINEAQRRRGPHDAHGKKSTTPLRVIDVTKP